MDVPTPRYSAYASGLDQRPVHALPDAVSFIDAAILFAERWGGEAEELAVVVTDEATGERQCFRVDLVRGEAAPC